MAPKDLDKLIEKYLQGNCTPEECDFIDQWYASLGRRGTSEPAHVEEGHSTAGDRILANVRHRIQPATSRLSLWRYAGIAATLVITLATAYYLVTSHPVAPDAVVAQAAPPEFKEITNMDDMSRREILPDGSIVVIAAQSTIRYRTGTDTGPREVYLKGEAYFDVAHNGDRPFFVYAGNVVTRVLGTSFVVRHRGETDKITVTVKTGKVTVYSRKASHKKTVLTPNHEAIYDQATDLVATHAVPAVRLHEERKNLHEMHFEETPIPQVLSLLTKIYDIDIVFREDILAGCVLTSSFYEEGLYDRIDVICTAIGASYKIAGAQIIIESNGCNLKTN